jgi:hypothetical protein
MAVNGGVVSRRPRALTVCVASSAAAHLLGAALALLLARPEPADPEPVAPDTVVVDLVEPPAAPAAAAPGSSGAEQRVTPSTPSADRPRARSARRDSSTPAGHARRPELPGKSTPGEAAPLSLAMRTRGAHEAPVRSFPGLRSWAHKAPVRPFGAHPFAHTLLPPELTDLRPSLRDEIPRPEPRGGGGGGSRGDGRGGTRRATRAEEDRRIKQQLDRLLAEDQATRDTRAGKVPPVIVEIMRDADKVFAPPWEMIEADSRKRGTVGATAKSMLRGWFRSYLAGLKAYRKMGSSLPGDRQREEPAMLSGYAELLRAAAKEAEALECEVCVDLVPGQPPKVHVARRSGRPSFDKMAKEALALAARLRDLQIQQEPDRKALEACYRFTAKFHRVPPLPAVMCTFDESKPSISCMYPMKKIVSKGVRLVIVRVKKNG